MTIHGYEITEVVPREWTASGLHWGPTLPMSVSQSLLLFQTQAQDLATFDSTSKKRRQSRILPRPCQNECPSCANPGVDEGWTPWQLTNALR